MSFRFFRMFTAESPPNAQALAAAGRRRAGRRRRQRAELSVGERAELSSGGGERHADDGVRRAGTSLERAQRPRAFVLMLAQWLHELPGDEVVKILLAAKLASLHADAMANKRLKDPAAVPAVTCATRDAGAGLQLAIRKLLG